MADRRCLALATIPRAQERATIGAGLRGGKVVFVGGQSGTGKSHLVASALLEGSKGKLLVVETKFDQRGSGAPLSNYRQALTDLVTRVFEHHYQGDAGSVAELLESNLETRQYEVLLEFLNLDLGSAAVEEDAGEDHSVGSNGSSEFFLEGDAAKESMGVLHSACKACVRMATELAPDGVVFAMDDIQWSCPSTRRAIRDIVSDPTIHENDNLVLLATYRTHEETASEGFYEWKEEVCQQLLEEDQESVQHIQLDNLSLGQVERLLMDTLHIPEEEESTKVRDLAHTLFGCTNGNLFFLQHLWRQLQDEQLITWDIHTFRYTWDVQGIRQRRSSLLSDNVVQTLTRRIHQMPQNVQDVLTIASLFGGQFDIRAVEAAREGLASATDDELPQVKLQRLVQRKKQQAHKAIDEGDYDAVIQLAEELQQLSSSSGQLPDYDDARLRVSAIEALQEAQKHEFVVRLDETHYKFAHDMIQFTAYSLIPDEYSLEWIHWKVSTHLAQQHQELLNDDSIFFATVDLLNYGATDYAEDGSGPELQHRVAKLNYKAGVKASKLSSFRAASRYAEEGIKILGANPFQPQSYDLALKLHNLLASTYFILGEINLSMEAAQQVLDHGIGKDTHRITAVLVMCECLLAKCDTDKLLDFGLNILERVEIKLPRHPPSPYVELEYQKMRSKISTTTDQDLMELPVMKDRMKDLALSIFSHLLIPLYQKKDFALSTLVACQMVHITLKYGWSKNNSGLGFACFASLIITKNHDIREGYRLGMAVERKSKKYNNVRAVATSAAITKWWLEPLVNGLDAYQESYRHAMKSGAISEAFECSSSYAICYFYSGLPLGPLLQDVDKYCNQYLEYNQHFYFFMLSPMWQLLLNLTGNSEDPGNVQEGRAIDMFKKLSNRVQVGEEMILCNQMTLSFYLGDLSCAASLAEKMRGMNAGIMKPSFWHVSLRFFFGLIAITSYRKKQTIKDKLEADKQLKYFRRMVKQGAINLVHKLHLLEAEMLMADRCFSDALFAGRGKGSEDAAMKKYDEAVITATRSGFLQDAALANYCCFQFCVSSKLRTHMAETYFKRSMEQWLSWGAVAVASSLAERYPEYCTSSSRDSLSVGALSSMSGTSIRSRPRFDATLSQQHHAEPNVKLEHQFNDSIARFNEASSN